MTNPLTADEAAWRFLITDKNDPDQFSLAIGSTVHLLRDQGCRSALAEQPMSMADIDEEQDVATTVVLTDARLSILAGMPVPRTPVAPRGATPRPGHALVANSAVILSVCPLPSVPGTVPSSLILCHVRKGAAREEWAIWHYDESAKSCYWGHYFNSEEAAFVYYLIRRAELTPA
jgi:hypothetical protein